MFLSLSPDGYKMVTVQEYILFWVNSRKSNVSGLITMVQSLSDQNSFLTSAAFTQETVRRAGRVTRVENKSGVAVAEKDLFLGFTQNQIYQ